MGDTTFRGTPVFASGLTDTAHICPERLHGKCPHDATWHCSTCSRTFSIDSSKKGADPPEGWRCRDCLEVDAFLEDYAKIPDTPLDKAIFWLTTNHRDWQHPCGDGIHNIDPEWLADILRVVKKFRNWPEVNHGR